MTMKIDEVKKVAVLKHKIVKKIRCCKVKTR